MKIQIGSAVVGDGQPPLIAVEIGINHNGDMDRAKALILAAKACGADLVKFQSYVTGDMVTTRDLEITYRSQGEEVTEPQFDMFKRYELTLDQLASLKRYADDKEIMFHVTPMNADTVEEAVTDLGCPVLKNGSDCLQHLDLIRAMGGTKRPTVISTGMATMAEIDNAVRAFRSTGNENLILLHCVASYPAPVTDANLRAMKTLRDAFGCLVGFSDHTKGNTAAIAAIAMGACWIEKHFTLDKNAPGPDHWFSADPGELRALTTASKQAYNACGDGVIGPKGSEDWRRAKNRLSCVAARRIEADSWITADDVAIRRSPTTQGVSPSERNLIIGMRILETIDEGFPIPWEVFK